MTRSAALSSVALLLLAAVPLGLFALYKFNRSIVQAVRPANGPGVVESLVRP